MLEVLAGDLRFVRLTSLLQLVEAEACTGVLSLVGNGEIRLSGGEIAEASAGPLSGYAAIRTLFFVPTGRFVLSVNPDGDAPKLPALVPITRAVLDGVRLLDEWARIGPLVLTAPAQVPSLPAPADALIAGLDGTSPLQSLVLKFKISPAMVVDPLLDLIEGGQLVESGPPATPELWPGVSALVGGGGPAPVASGNPSVDGDKSIPAQTKLTPVDERDYDELLLDGRRLLREGDFDAAERCFSRAVDLRPDDRIAAQNLRRVRQLRESGAERGTAWVRPGSAP